MKRLALVLALLVGSCPAWAATKYVDNSGSPACSDTGSTGSQAAPFCTVTYGVAHIAGGDTLYVKNGTYPGGFTITGPSGTAGAHTLISAFPGHAPVLDNGSINSGRIKISHSCQYIDFVGFTITHHNQGLYLDDDAGTDVACTNVTVDSLTIHDVGQEGIAVRAGSPTGPRNFVIKNSTIYNTGLLAPAQNGEGIYVGNSSGVDNTNGVTLLHNTIHDTSSECIELKGDSHDIVVDGNDLSNCITSNSGFGNNGGAIELDEPRTIVSSPAHIIRNNIIHNLPLGSGITKRGIRIGTGATVYNNILYGIDASYSAIYSNSPNFPRLVYHNTCDCTTAQAIVNSGGTALDSQNNLGPTTAGNNLAFASGFVVNASIHDYRLVAASAPINAGADLTATVPTDIVGTSRSAVLPPDIGAYEFVAAGTRQATVHWTDLSSTEDGFEVWRCPGAGVGCTNYTFLATVGANVVSYVDPASPLPEACYTVRATLSGTSGSSFATGACTPTNASPTVTLTTPTASPIFTATDSHVALGGTASDDGSVVSVTWACNVCGSGTATGTVTWSVPEITLHLGVNIITVTATDDQGAIGTDVITITLQPIVWGRVRVHL